MLCRCSTRRVGRPYYTSALAGAPDGQSKLAVHERGGSTADSRRKSEAVAAEPEHVLFDAAQAKTC